MHGLVLLLLAVFLAGSAVPADSAARSVVGWECADDTSASAVLEDGGSPSPLTHLPTPQPIAVGVPGPPHDTPRAPVPATTRGRAPPAR